MCDERIFEVLELCQRIWILKENRTSKDPGIEELKELLEKFKEGLTGRTQEVFLPGDRRGGKTERSR